MKAFRRFRYIAYLLFVFGLSSVAFAQAPNPGAQPVQANSPANGADAQSNGADAQNGANTQNGANAHIKCAKCKI